MRIKIHRGVELEWHKSLPDYQGSIRLKYIVDLDTVGFGGVMKPVLTDISNGRDRCFPANAEYRIIDIAPFTFIISGTA